MAKKHKRRAGPKGQAKKQAREAYKQQKGETWGLWDTQDKCWLGNDAGPKMFSDFDEAKLAAAVANVQLGWPAGRVRERRLIRPAEIFRDKVEAKMTPLEAIEMIEDDRAMG
jgi:hypothetical protein